MTPTQTMHSFSGNPTNRSIDLHQLRSLQNREILMIQGDVSLGKAG